MKIKIQDILINDEGKLILTFVDSKRKNDFDNLFYEDSCGNPSTFIKFSKTDTDLIKRKLRRK